MEPLPRRLSRLPPARVAGDHVRVAETPRARLLGLAGLAAPPPCGLLLPGTRSVHTFGMRFALDLHWLDIHGRIIRTDANVRPNRIRTCRTARAVIERPARNEGAGPDPGPRSDD
jgi:uncharacterized protein